MNTFAIYFNGTDEAADFGQSIITSLANVLHKLTVQDENNEALCLDGCAINNPYIRDLGGFFTWHLQDQVNQVEKIVREKCNASEEKLTLNLYGFSRGAAATFWLAKKLKDIPPEKITINILAFEAVPGNFINTVYLDQLFGTGLTLSAEIADLRECKNIRRINALYTHIPLPDFICHAPILPALPENCECLVDIVPGCHKDAELFRISDDLYGTKIHVEPYNSQSAIAFHQVISFLSACGTKFDFTKVALDPSLQENAPLAQMYASEVAKLTPREDLIAQGVLQSTNTLRAMHFRNYIYARAGHQQQLNLFHQTLLGKEPNPKNCILYLQDNHPKPSYVNGQKTAAYFVYPMLALAGSYVAYNNLRRGPRSGI